MIFPVRVEEIGFSDRFTAPSARGPKQSKEKEEPGVDIQSFASSESSKEPWPAKQQCNVVLEDEAVNVICMRKELNDYCQQKIRVSGG
ncbi:hypothetical protein V6N13_046380 [Hibiscus sabdariffa]|uniref:Uncharacterized protein n=1 Tax=Hibiscus sabdariffa TaxID=183260 RepID=A0ABR2D9Z3_9ROSI